MPRIGLIGCGGMGNTHASCYPRIPDANVVAYADIRPDRAQAAATKYGGNAYESAADLVAAEKPDIVDICVPTTEHDKVARLCLAERIAVICEKPITRTYAEARKLVDDFHAAGVPFLPAQVVRWFPMFESAREQIKSGAVGEPAVVRITRGGSFPRGTGNWYGDFATSGGVLLDLMIHDFDWLRWCFGDVDRVTAGGLMAENGPGEKDYALAVLRFKSGVIAHCEGTWAHTDGFRVNLEVSGDKGVLEWTSQFPFPVKVRKDAAESGPAVAVPESPSEESPYLKELRDLVKAITSGAAIRVSAEDGVAAVAVSEACLESARTGQPVSPACR